MIRILARFATSTELTAAARAARAAGFRRTEAFTPFPMHEVTAALGYHERRLAGYALAGAILVAVGAYFMQWYASVISYPYVVGGKPLHSWPAFLLVTFETGVLTAVLIAVFGMMFANGLPRPHHPVFDWPAFDRASDDGFFLLVEDEDGQRVQAFLEEYRAAEWQELES